jgi:hypothetical protein
MLEPPAQVSQLKIANKFLEAIRQEIEGAKKIA